MASFVNKITNATANATGGLFGREGITKLSNSLNQVFNSKSKYRDHLASGNVIQLISRMSQRSLQICSVDGQPALLYVNGSGLIGAEYPNTQFKLLINPRNGHYTFSNSGNYLCIDTMSFLPCIKPEPAKKKNKPVQIPTEFEFRLHEIFGSDEYFSLEFVGRPGNYLAVLPSGVVQTTTDKTDKNSHFQLNLVFQFQQFAGLVPVQQTVVLATNTAASNTSLTPSTSSGASGTSTSYSAADAKRAEAEAAAGPQTAAPSLPPSAASLPPTAPFNLDAPSSDTPPAYTSLYPRLNN